MGKVVLVTGGTSGIGKAICTYLSAQGYTVYGSGRSVENGEESENFKLVQLDLLEDESIKKAIDFILKKEGRIDVLINNAGIGMAGSIEDSDVKEVKKLFDINIHGVLRVTQEVLPYMRKQNAGQIINISSLGGLMGLPYRGVYSASKYAVEGLSESLSMEVKKWNIYVVLVEPGDFKTNIKNNRIISPLKEDSPYFDQYTEMLKRMDADVDNGNNPEELGKLIYKITQKKKPKLRYYKASGLQKFSILVKRFVSGRRYENMLMKHYKLLDK